MTVRPEYPAWFEPLANLAEGSPFGALAVLIGLVLIGAALGFVAAMLLL